MKSFMRTTFASLALSMGIVPSTSAGETDPMSVVSSANTQWNQALNSGNAKSLANLYTENATVSPGNGQILSGRAEIEKLFQSFVDAGVHNHRIETLEVHGDDQLLYQVARWQANGAAKDGQTPTFGGILMSILVKDGNGRWLARSHVWNVTQ